MEQRYWHSRLRAMIAAFWTPRRPYKLELVTALAVLLLAVVALIRGAVGTHPPRPAARSALPRATWTASAPVESSTMPPEAALSTATPAPSGFPSPSATSARPTPSPTGAATGTVTPLPRPAAPAGQAARVPPLLHPAVDAAYDAQDTLEGTGPGPAGPLSGLPTRPELAGRRPVAVVIDNFAPDARPQTGLNRASLVFETLAEGGITRLMAVYLERDAPVVGPVRSARIYFDSWADGLRAIYAHAGGNSDALYELGHGLNDLANADDLNLPVVPDPLDQPYWRSPARLMPHNLYTSTTLLRAYAHQAGDATFGLYSAALPHRAPDQYQHRARSAWIDVPFSSPEYEVRYLYDRAGNRYLRQVGGVLQADPLSGRPVAPSNVVVLFTALTPDHDAFTPSGVNIHTVGEGRALFFRDGHLVAGRWRKRSVRAPLALLDARGRLETFNPGQTWIEVVPTGTAVTWHTS